MAATKEGTSIGPKVLYDTRLIYSCVIALQASNRDVDIKDILSFELSSLLVSLFDESLFLIITSQLVHWAYKLFHVFSHNHQSLLTRIFIIASI